jgi:hypothetical protein
MSDTIRAAGCSEKMGETAALAGDVRTAEDNYHQALVIVEPLMVTNPPRLDALYTAADAYSGLGDLRLRQIGTSVASTSRRKARSEACLWYGKSVAVWHQVEHPNRSTPNGFDAGDPALVAKKLQQCQTAPAHN